MYNTALRIVKDTAEAEDIMQEAFLKAFTKLSLYKGDATFGSWLKRIVVNDSLSSYQKSKRMEVIPLEHDLYKLEDQEGISPCDTDSLELKNVLQTIGTLKESYRIALTLNLIEGYDYDEMSDILQMTNANCRTTVSRAKSSLRKKLGVAVNSNN